MATRKKAPKRKPKPKPKPKPRAKRASSPKRRAKRPSSQSRASGFAFEIQRVKLDRSGRDSRGVEYGPNTRGERLFHVRVVSRATGTWSETHVRAATKRAARERVADQMLSGLPLETGELAVRGRQKPRAAARAQSTPPRHERIGNYSIAPNNDGWCVFDWTRDEDVDWFPTRVEAVRRARKLAAG